MARFEKSLCWFAGAFLIAATALFLSCDSGSKTARGDATGANEEYKVFQAPYNAGPQLELGLNRLAKQGWKVRTTIASYVILAR